MATPSLRWCKFAFLMALVLTSDFTQVAASFSVGKSAATVGNNKQMDELEARVLTLVSNLAKAESEVKTNKISPQSTTNFVKRVDVAHRNQANHKARRVGSLIGLGDNSQSCSGDPISPQSAICEVQTSCSETNFFAVDCSDPGIESPCKECPLGWFSQAPVQTCDYCDQCQGSCPTSTVVSQSCTPSTKLKCACDKSVGFAENEFDYDVASTCTCASGLFQSVGTSLCISCTASCASGSFLTTSCTSSQDIKCQCTAGFHDSRTQTSGSFTGTSVTCVECAAGTYQPNVGSASCNPCPAGATCPRGSTDFSCNAGFELLNGVCSACLVDTAKAEAGNGRCQACPTDKTTSGETGATSCRNKEDKDDKDNHDKKDDGLSLEEILGITFGCVGDVLLVMAIVAGAKKYQAKRANQGPVDANTFTQA
jgi:hypothetical protein